MDQHLDRRDEATMDVIDGLVTGEMGRDDFIKRMAAVGFSASPIGRRLPATGEGCGPARRRIGACAEGGVNYVGHYGGKTQRAGGKTLYLIPGLHGGSVVLFYRKDLFKAAGLQPPTTWPAYLNAAKKLNTGGVAGNSMIAKSGD